jgi:hypothetical protein
MTLAAGSKLGPYEIAAPLGAGGMGAGTVNQIAWNFAKN